MSSIADADDAPSLYRTLGLRPVINAAAAHTTLGGSVMPPEVVQAMVTAAGSFVSINDLIAAVGRRIAELTRNEAATVTAGCAAGLAAVTAGLIAGRDPYLTQRLPDTSGLRRDVLIHRSHRNWFDQPVRTVGARLVEFGLPYETTPADLEGSITDQTIAVLYVIWAQLPTGTLTLEQTIEIAHRRGVPVVVDAASQLPPSESLWRFTRELGADVAVFSGGKDLRGPQHTGIVLGKREIVEAAARNSYPHFAIGRPMKIGKEGIVGVLAALERYLALDHTARLADCERQVRLVVDGLAGTTGARVERIWGGESGEPLPRAVVRLEPGRARHDREGLRAALRAGDPIVEVDPAPDGVIVNPACLEPGEMEIVVARLRSALDG